MILSVKKVNIGPHQRQCNLLLLLFLFGRCQRNLSFREFIFTPAITMSPREGDSNLPMDIAFNSSSSIVDSVSNNELAAENANLKRQLEELQLQENYLAYRLGYKLMLIKQLMVQMVK